MPGLHASLKRAEERRILVYKEKCLQGYAEAASTLLGSCYWQTAHDKQWALAFHAVLANQVGGGNSAADTICWTDRKQSRRVLDTSSMLLIESKDSLMTDVDLMYDCMDVHQVALAFVLNARHATSL